MTALVNYNLNNLELLSSTAIQVSGYYSTITFELICIIEFHHQIATMQFVYLTRWANNFFITRARGLSWWVLTALSLQITFFYLIILGNWMARVWTRWIGCQQLIVKCVLPIPRLGESFWPYAIDSNTHHWSGLPQSTLQLQERQDRPVCVVVTSVMNMSSQYSSLHWLLPPQLRW